MKFIPPIRKIIDSYLPPKADLVIKKSFALIENNGCESVITFTERTFYTEIVDQKDPDFKRVWQNVIIAIDLIGYSMVSFITDQFLVGTSDSILRKLIQDFKHDTYEFQNIDTRFFSAYRLIGIIERGLRCVKTGAKERLRQKI